MSVRVHAGARVCACVCDAVPPRVQGTGDYSKGFLLETVYKSKPIRGFVFLLMLPSMFCLSLFGIDSAARFQVSCTHRQGHNKN